MPFLQAFQDATVVVPATDGLPAGQNGQLFALALYEPIGPALLQLLHWLATVALVSGRW